MRSLFDFLNAWPAILAAALVGYALVIGVFLYAHRADLFSTFDLPEPPADDLEPLRARIEAADRGAANDFAQAFKRTGLTFEELDRAWRSRPAGDD